MMMYLHPSLTEGNKDVCKNDQRNTNEKACDNNIETKTDNDNENDKFSHMITAAFVCCAFCPGSIVAFTIFQIVSLPSYISILLFFFSLFSFFVYCIYNFVA